MNKNKLKQIIICFISIFLVIICLISVLNLVLPAILDSILNPYVRQKYNSVEEAIYAMELYERELNDSSLDYCPPYEIKYQFDYENNTIVVYTYCYTLDGTPSNSGHPSTYNYVVRMFRHNNDGTVSFEDGGFADFELYEPDGYEDYYYFTNIKTNKGTKSICFLYLPKDSNKTIYYDGIKTEKQLVSIDDAEFYICYAISNKDSFISNLLTPINERHQVEIK